MPSTLKRMSEVFFEEKGRIKSGLAEWDRVLGGGILPGSFTIVTGDPGIGKSTLLLQIADRLAEHHSVFYFSTEESLAQLKLRAQRLGCLSDNVLFSDQALFDSIASAIQMYKPAVAVIDSIQNCVLDSSDAIPGGVSQLRELALRFMRLAKELGIAIILTGHITKEGAMAGPKTLEHMVDTVLYLSGEEQWQTRMLRAVKNRFGPAGELGFFEMESAGLVEVADINAVLLADATTSPGSVLVSYQEGSRFLLLELQALAVASKFSVPQRVISGVDYNQVILIAAILEKHLKIKFSAYDIFFKVSGGFKIKGSAIDLGIAIALLSTFFQKALSERTVAIGEINLAGIIKPAALGVQGLKEMMRLGVTSVALSHRQQTADVTKCKICSFSKVHDVLMMFE